MKTILDISSLVYGGNPETRIKGFPVGGIRKVMGLINSGITTSDFVLCFDAGKLLKKELLPTYKAGRVPNYSVMAQIEILKDIFIDCGVPYYCEDGYEADDWIYSFCNCMGQLWDTSYMEIRSDDRDLACCVTSNTVLKSATSNGRLINKDNFEARVMNGTKVPFNTILLWKMFNGDASDNYKGMKVPGLYFESVSSILLEWIKPLLASEQLPEIAFSSREVCESLFETVGGSLSDLDRNTIKNQIDIVYPRLAPVCDVEMAQVFEELQTTQLFKVEQAHLKLCTMASMDFSKFSEYCTLLGLNKLRKKRVDSESELAVNFYSRLQLESKALTSGELAVMRYGDYQVEHPDGISLENMELPL